MKTIKTADGQIIYGHQLNDLDELTREKVISEHGQFLYETDECEEDGTEPQFPDEDVIIENLEINGYLFFDDGEIMPIVYHYKGNVFVKNTWGNKQIECTIE